MLMDFDPGVLPDLPQKRRLIPVVGDLWQDPKVVAIWLGGSLARGEGDRYSDVDLRVAFPTAAFDPATIPASARRLSEEAVASITVNFGVDATLYHMLLGDGEFYDLLVQTVDREPTAEQRLVIVCRDAAFGTKLAGGSDPVVRHPPADASTIRQVIVNYWMGQQKHLRVLYRKLPLLSWEGEHRLRQELIRLWYALATGYDCGPIHALTIHTASPVGRAVNELMGDRALALLGQSLGMEEAMMQAAMSSQEEVARVGRLLAEKLGFDYPSALEATVKQSWQRFRRASEEQD